MTTEHRPVPALGLLLGLCLVPLLGLGGCGTSDDGPDAATMLARASTAVPEGQDPEIEDTSQAGLAAFAQAGDYLDWLAEPAAHASAGPTVAACAPSSTTCFRLVAGGPDPSPARQHLVKQLLGADDEVPATPSTSRSAMARRRHLALLGSLRPAFEGFYGVANSTCTGCHSQGQDFVLVALP